ncbi:MAG: hypothetical protein INR73_02285 [Williamsia sp.]|nr:hypothetical protein [Williamsia sp.]
MKKRSIVFFLLAILFASCIKEEVKSYTGKPVLEFDAAVLNSAATGVKFPVLTRVPKYGLTAVSSGTTADPQITRSSGAIKFRVNLVGPQSPAEQVLSYKIVSADYSSLLDVPTGSSARLAAVPGTHFNTTGTFTVPANSSFGEVTITVVNPGTSSTIARYLVLEITGNESATPSENYKRIAIQISET